jgi:hypothetical protein
MKHFQTLTIYDGLKSLVQLLREQNKKQNLDKLEFPSLNAFSLLFLIFMFSLSISYFNTIFRDR